MVKVGGGASACLLTLSTALLPCGAKAQADLKPLPVTSAVDENGVDVVNWSFSYDVAPISLGPSDQDPVKVSVFLPSELDDFSTNLRIQDPSWVSSARVSASVGAQSWSFYGFGGSSEPGSQVEIFYGGAGNNSARVYARDGSIITFDVPDWFSPGSVGPVNFCAAQIEKPNGEVLKFYNEHYAPQCRTRSVVSNRGYQIKYDYSPTGWSVFRTKITLINNVYEYCNPAAATCQLNMTWPSISFSNQSGFRTYVLNDGKTWTMSSTGLINPGQSTPSISWATQTYYPVNEFLGSRNWRVTSVVREGQAWSYTYPSSDAQLGGVNGQLVRVQDPLGNVKRYLRSWAVTDGDPNTGEYESPNLMRKVADEFGNVTTYDYNAQFLPSEVVMPEGNKHVATYDGVGNILTYSVKAKPGSGIPDAVKTYAYNVMFGVNECCDRPTSVTDARGNITEYTYDSVHKGILTETGPAASIGAPRPVKRYAYTQRYAWVKDSSGNYIQATSPIWVLESEKTCRTSATVGSACAAGASDEVTVSYDYGPNSGPNNLWIRGKAMTADGVSLRTCYSYDAVGNKISETPPSVGLASCP